MKRMCTITCRASASGFPDGRLHLRIQVYLWRFISCDSHGFHDEIHQVQREGQKKSNQGSGVLAKGDMCIYAPLDAM
jgi:hypothetical protein